MTTAPATLNARCSGAWRAADGIPVTVLERIGRVAVVALEEPAAGYKVGRTVTLPAAWVTEDAPPRQPAATVEVDAIAVPTVNVCPWCGRPLP